MGDNDKNTSPWAVINDYTKTVITLATSILAFTITFAEKLTGPYPSTELKWLLGATWTVLVLSIIFGLWTAARLSNHLRGKEDSNACILSSNITFFLLVIAASLFIVIGLTQLGKQRPIISHLLQAERDAKVATSLESEWSLRSLLCDPEKGTLDLSYSVGQTGLLVHIVMDEKTGRLLKIERVKQP